jgi:hypothetical protein
VRRRAPEIVALLAVLYGTFLRLEVLPGRLLFGDEYHAMALIRRDYAEVLSSFGYNGTGIGLSLLRRIAVDLFGPTDLAYRLPAILGGLAGLVLMYPISQRLVGRNAAAISTVALALNPLHIYYSHFSRSYSLACLGCLLLVGALRRAVDERPLPRRGYVTIAIVSALIPYLHLSALGVVVAAGVGAMALLVRRGRSRRELGNLVVCFVIAGVLCIALHLPAWKPFWGFYSMSVGLPNPFLFGPIDVGRLMFGSSIAAIVMLLGLPVASLWMYRTGSDSAWILVPAALLPIALLAVQSPIGSEISYAHYLITSIPFMVMILAWAIVALAERISHDPPAATRLAIALGSAMFVLAHLAGPRGFAHTDDGPFANNYISQHAQSAFDVPYTGTPDFYEFLAAEPDDVRIIEAPALVNMRVLLYRNYFLQHRKQVLLGFFNRYFGVTGPYVPLFDPAQIRASGADYLVYHRDIEKEVRAYWETVEPSQEKDALRVKVPTGQQVTQLRAMLGEPFRESDALLVWKLLKSNGHQ